MSRVRFTDGRRVDVVDADCEFRPCFALGFDKGTFAQGRGYTSYHADGPRPVCWTRHMNGCPHVGVHLVCGGCRAMLALVPADEALPDMPDVCRECGSDALYWLADVLADPLPCCDSPDVPKPRKGSAPYKQRCRNCGAKLTGKRLDMIRAAESSPPQDVAAEQALPSRLVLSGAVTRHCDIPGGP